MAKLTKAQTEALAHVSRGYGALTLRFTTGEALRRKGLVVRETKYIVKYVYANADGEYPQSRPTVNQPWIQHEWFLTPSGRTALSNQGGPDRAE